MTLYSQPLSPRSWICRGHVLAWGLPSSSLHPLGSQKNFVSLGQHCPLQALFMKGNRLIALLHPTPISSPLPGHGRYLSSTYYIPGGFLSMSSFNPSQYPEE